MVRHSNDVAITPIFIGNLTRHDKALYRKPPVTTMNTPTVAPTDHHQHASDQLNQNCLCVTLDQPALCKALERETGDETFYDKFIRPRSHLFSNVPVFLSNSAVGEMHQTVMAIEAVARIETYQSAVLSWAPEIARENHGPAGALMGYDFHLGAEGPKLIEINTNAGGAFLNVLLARAQRECCKEMKPALIPAGESFENVVFSMFQEEWARQHRIGTANRIAIVDDHPEQQYLYPEFILAQKILADRGVHAVIADAGQIRYDGDNLSIDGETIELVYNRLTDFAFEQPEHSALRDAYMNGSVVVTPNPHNHALLADKRNLALLSDLATLEAWHVDPSVRDRLSAIPNTVLVTAENAGALWTSRKNLFFKPFAGHGGKAVYRGDKVTKNVWAEIIRGGYVAQTLVRPSERMIKIDGASEPCKMDLRLYTYGGKMLLAAARLYRGQTTNFRTPGGGFAPVFVI